MTSQENEGIARLWFELMSSTSDPSIADEIIHQDFAPEGIQLDKKGPEQVKDEIKQFRSVFPDLKYEIVETAVLPDRVWVRFRAKGTQKGSIWGFPPTGNTIEFDGAAILYLKDNKVINQWGALSFYDVLTELGLVPPLWTLKDHLHWPR
jgi:predicted ester cyclase